MSFDDEINILAENLIVLNDKVDKQQVAIDRQQIAIDRMSLALAQLTRDFLSEKHS